RDVSADLNPVGERRLYGATHRCRVAAVKSAGDARRGDERHDPGVVTQHPPSEALPHVDVDIKHSGLRHHSPSKSAETGSYANALAISHHCGCGSHGGFKRSSQRSI